MLVNFWCGNLGGGAINLEIWGAMAPLVPLVPSSLTDLEANEIYSKAEDRECIYNNTVLASTCGNSTACLATKQEACCSFPPPPPVHYSWTHGGSMHAQY